MAGHELNAIAEIILKPRHYAQDAEIHADCDQVFIERLKVFPQALLLGFWQTHFEWRDLVALPGMSGRILDFGCGSGHSDIFVARFGATIHGIDLSGIGIDIANHLRSHEAPEIQRRVSFQMADVRVDRPADGPFDCAWASHVFEHIADPAEIFDGLRAWLKPGAPMLISVPLGHAYDDPSHLHHWATAEALGEHLAPHAAVQSVEALADKQVIRALCRIG